MLAALDSSLGRTDAPFSECTRTAVEALSSFCDDLRIDESLGDVSGLLVHGCGIELELSVKNMLPASLEVLVPNKSGRWLRMRTKVIQNPFIEVTINRASVENAPTT